MNSNFNARMSMYDSLALYCQKNQSIIATLPALDAKVSAFNTLLDEIKGLTQKYASPIKGITDLKRASKKALVESLMLHASALQAYARANEEKELLGKVKIAPTKAAKLGASGLDALARDIYELSNAYAGKLGDYGITPAIIAELDAAHKAFAEVAGAPKAARASRKEALQLLNDKMKQLNGLVDGEMDALVYTFRKTYPGFVAGYDSARGIDNSHSYTTRTGGTVTKADQTPAAGAKVELLEAGTDSVKYSTTTDAEGTFSIKGLYHTTATPNLPW